MNKLENFAILTTLKDIYRISICGYPMKKIFKPFGKLLLFFLLSTSLTSVVAASEPEEFFAEEEEFLEEDFYGGEEFVSIATGEKQLISKAPAVASVITAQDIENMGANDLDEVLESVPGLHVSRNNFYSPIYSIRGIYSEFNAQVLVLINGLPITDLFNGNRGVFWAGMPTKAISRIEIIRGPGSAVYGADAFSGVINIVTKKGTELNGNKVGLTFGSFDTKGGWFSLGNKNDNQEYSFIVEYSSTDGHKRIIESDRQSIFDSLDGTNVSLAPGSVNLSRDSVDTRFDYQKDKFNLKIGLQRRTNIGTGAGVAEALDPVGKFESNRRSLDFIYHNPNVATNWDLKAEAAYFYITQEVENNITLFPPGTEFGVNASPFPNGVIGNPQIFEEHYRFNFSAFYNGFKSHSIRFGVGHHIADMYKVKESKNFGLDGDSQPIPPDQVVNVDDTNAIFLPEGGRKNNYVFIQDVWRVANDWELTSGIRYDNYSDFGSTTNPRLALVWSTAHNLTTKFLYGKAFRAPSFSETRNQNNPVALGRADLKPEEIETFEFAVDYQARQDLSYAFNLFTYVWDDIIDYFPIGGGRIQADNRGQRKGNGFEFEFDYQVNENFKIYGNYALQDSEEQDGSHVAKTPKQKVYLNLGYDVSSSWHLNLDTNLILDRKRAQGDTRRSVDDYNLVNIKIGYRLPENNWGASLAVRNLFDENAREPGSTLIPFDLPLEPRNTRFEVFYEF